MIGPRTLRRSYADAYVEPDALGPADARKAGLDVHDSAEALDRALTERGLWRGLFIVFWRSSLGYLFTGVCLVVASPFIPHFVRHLVDEPTTRTATLLTGVLVAASLLRFAGTVQIRYLVYRIDLSVQQVIYRRLLRADAGWLARRKQATTTFLLEYGQMTSQVAFVPEFLVNTVLATVFAAILVVEYGWVGVIVTVAVACGVLAVARLASSGSAAGKRFLDAEQSRSSLIEVFATAWQAVARARLARAVCDEVQSIRRVQLRLLRKWSRLAAVNVTADYGIAGVAVWLAAALSLTAGADLAAGRAVGLLVLVRMLMGAVTAALGTYRSINFTRHVGADLHHLIAETNGQEASSPLPDVPHGARLLVVGRDDDAVTSWLSCRLDGSATSTDCWVGRSQPALDGVIAQNVVLWSRSVDRQRYVESTAAAALFRRAADGSAKLVDGQLLDCEHETLSDGELVRLSLARALYFRPHTLVLDDVFAPLDPVTAQEVGREVLSAPTRPTVYLRSTRPEPLRWVDGIAVVEGSGVDYIWREDFDASREQLVELLGGDFTDSLAADLPTPVRTAQPAAGGYEFVEAFDPPARAAFDLVGRDASSFGLGRVVSALWPRWALVGFSVLLAGAAAAELIIAGVVETGATTMDSVIRLGVVVLLGCAAIFAGRLLPLHSARPRIDRLHRRLLDSLARGHFAGRHHVVPARVGRDFYALEIRIPSAVASYLAGVLGVVVALLVVVTAGPIAVPALLLLAVLGVVQVRRGQDALETATRLSAAARVPLLSFGTRTIGDPGFHRSVPLRRALAARFAELGTVRAAAIARWSNVQLRTILGVELLSLGVLAVAIWGTTLGSSSFGIGDGVVVYAAYIFSQQVGALIDQTQMMNGVLQSASRVFDLAEEGERASRLDGTEPEHVGCMTPPVTGHPSTEPVLAGEELVPLSPELGAVAPVDVTLFSGEWQVVVGPSGVGKSTLLRSIGGARSLAAGCLLQRPETARIALLDSDLPALPMAARQVLDATGVEALRQLCAAAGREPIAVDLHLDRLSHADRQLVSLARAVAADPALLLLDEATSALPAAQEARVMDALKGLLPDVAALVVLHRRANQDGIGSVPPLELRAAGAGVAAAGQR